MTYENDLRLRPKINPYLWAFFDALSWLNVPWRLWEKWNYYSELQRYWIISNANPNEKNFELSATLRSIQTLTWTWYYYQVFEDITDGIMDSVQSCVWEFLPKERVVLHWNSDWVLLAPQFDFFDIKGNDDLLSSIESRRKEYFPVFKTSRIILNEAKVHLSLSREINKNDDFLYVENVKNRKIVKDFINKIISDLEQYIKDLENCLSKAEDYEFFLDNWITKEEHKRREADKEKKAENLARSIRESEESKKLILENRKKIWKKIFIWALGLWLAFAWWKFREEISDGYQDNMDRFSIMYQWAKEWIGQRFKSIERQDIIEKNFKKWVHESDIESSPFSKGRSTITEILEQFTNKHDFWYLKINSNQDSVGIYSKLRIELSNIDDPASLKSAEFYYKDQNWPRLWIRIEKVHNLWLFKLTPIENEEFDESDGGLDDNVSGFDEDLLPEVYPHGAVHPVDTSAIFHKSHLPSDTIEWRAFLKHIKQYAWVERNILTAMPRLQFLLPYIFDTVKNYNLKYWTNFDPLMIIALIIIESNWDSEAISHTWAVWLMQMVPSTWAAEQRLKIIQWVMNESSNPLIVVPRALRHLFGSIAWKSRIDIKYPLQLLPKLNRYSKDWFIDQWIIDFFQITWYNAWLHWTTKYLSWLWTINPMATINHMLEVITKTREIEEPEESKKLKESKKSKKTSKPKKIEKYQEARYAEAAGYYAKIMIVYQALVSWKYDKYFITDWALEQFYLIEYVNNSGKEIFLSYEKWGFYGILKWMWIDEEEIKLFRELNRHFTGDVLDWKEPLPKKFKRWGRKQNYTESIMLIFQNPEILRIFKSTYNVTQIWQTINKEIPNDIVMDWISPDLQSLFDDILSWNVLAINWVSKLKQYLKDHDNLNLASTSSINELLEYLWFVQLLTQDFTSQSVEQIITSANNIPFTWIVVEEDEKINNSERAYAELLEKIKLLNSYYSVVAELNIRPRESGSDRIGKSFEKWDWSPNSVRVPAEVENYDRSIKMLKKLKNLLNELDKQLLTLDKNSKTAKMSSMNKKRWWIRYLLSNIDRILEYAK